MKYYLFTTDDGEQEIQYPPNSFRGFCDYCENLAPLGPFGKTSSLSRKPKEICQDCANHEDNIAHTVKVYREMQEFKKSQNEK